jgi:tetratricopeptide (TPR) repeat protein
LSEIPKLKVLRPDFEASKESFEKALGLFQSSGFSQGIVSAYGGIGTALAFISPDKPELAKQNFKQALSVADKIQYRLGRGNQLANLGLVYKRDAVLGPTSQRKENLDLAEANLQKSLKIHRSLGFKLGEAKQLMNLADVARLQGPSQCAEARDRIAKSISIFRDIGAGDLLNRATDLSEEIRRDCLGVSNTGHAETHPY